MGLQEIRVVGSTGNGFDAAQNASAPSSTLVVAGVYNSSLPTITSGNASALQLDAKGQQLIDVNYWAGTALAVPQSFGTAPSGVVIGTSSDIYVAGTRARSNQTTTASGVVDVNVVGSLGVTNSVSNGTFTALTDNTTAVKVIAGTNALKTDLSSVAGTATVTAASGVVKVGITGNAAAALDFAGQNAASPANSVLVGAQFNTTPTTITSGNASPLQLDASGNLLVNVKAGSSGNAAASATGSAVPASADYIGFNSSGNLVGVSATNPLPVTGSFSASTTGSQVTAADAISNADALSFSGSTSEAWPLLVAGMAYNGSTWDRLRTAGIGSSVAATGLLADAPYGQFNAPFPTSSVITTAGDLGLLQSDSQSILQTSLTRAAQPFIIQKTNAVSTNSVTTLSASFSSNNTAGNTIVVLAAAGSSSAMSVSDTLGNTYTEAINLTSGAQSAIFYATNCKAGANTNVTLSCGSSSAAIVIYEVYGLLSLSSQLGQIVPAEFATGFGTTTNNNISTSSVQPLLPNEYAFVMVAMNANNTGGFSTYSPFNLDFNQTTLGTQSGLFATGAFSQALTGLTPCSFSTQLATATSCATLAVFKPVAVAVSGTVLTVGTLVSAGDGVSNSNILSYSGAPSHSYPLLTALMGYNGSTWDRVHTYLGYIRTAAEMTGTTPASAPSTTAIVGGIYNSAAPSPSSGQTLPLQLDSSGNLQVNIKAGGGGGTQYTGSASVSSSAIVTSAVSGYDGTDVQPLNVKDGINTTGGAPPVFSTAGATNANVALTTTVSPNSGIPAIIQKIGAASSGTPTSLSSGNFGANNTVGNSIVVVCAVGNTGTIKITDTLGNSYTQAYATNNGTIQQAVFYATNILAGTNAVTITPSAGATCALEAYEVSGLIGVGGGGSSTANSTTNQQDSVGVLSSLTGNNTNPNSGVINTACSNQIAFGGIAIQTANSTPTAYNPWSKDADLVPSTPTNLFGLHSFSQPLGVGGASVYLSATITSDPWVCGFATFRPALPTVGTVLDGTVIDGINTSGVMSGGALAVPGFTTAGSTGNNPAITTSLSPVSGVPVIIQKISGTGSGSQASLTTANFTMPNTPGNSIVVVVGVGNNGSIKITDTNGNAYTQAVVQANSTTFEVGIFYATNVIGGINAVTVTPSASVSLDIVAYEVSGIIGMGGGGSSTANSTVNQQGAVDFVASASGSSTSPASGSAATAVPNEIAFGGIATGTAAQTPSAYNPWNKDFTLNVGGTQSGLFSLSTFSQSLGGINAAVSLSATITTEPWACAIVSFKPAVQAIQGQVVDFGQYNSAAPVLTSGNYSPLQMDSSGNVKVNLSASSGTITVSQTPVTSGGCSTAVSQALTTSVSVKASAGQIYGYQIFNPNTATVYCFYYNTTSAPTIGSTTNLIMQIGIPAGGAANVPFDSGIAFSTGIYLAVSTSATSSTAPGTGLIITSIFK